jgi:hypothetical protein
MCDEGFTPGLGCLSNGIPCNFDDGHVFGSVPAVFYKIIIVLRELSVYNWSASLVDMSVIRFIFIAVRCRL